MKPRVVYWNNIPSPYMVERFNAIAARDNIDFEAWFNEVREPERSWRVEETSWKFKHRYLPALRQGNMRLSFPTPLLDRQKPDLLVSLYAEPSFLLGWELARLRGIRTAFWSEVTFDRWVERRPWKESIKRYIFPRTDAIITAGHDGRAFARRYGAKDEQIFVVPHVIDAAYFREAYDAALVHREGRRQELGLRGVTFIYVGRLWWGKGLHTLLQTFRVLQQKAEGEASLLIVGDGPEEERLRERCVRECIPNVVFAGFQQRERLPLYYASADALVFPTLGDPYGLVVDEAMACGLPVISTSAAGELSDRIEDGREGFIIPPDDQVSLLQRMELIAANPDLRRKMGHSAKERLKHSSPEGWAMNFESAVMTILEGKDAVLEAQAAA